MDREQLKIELRLHGSQYTIDYQQHINGLVTEVIEPLPSPLISELTLKGWSVNDEDIMVHDHNKGLVTYWYEFVPNKLNDRWEYYQQRERDDWSFSSSQNEYEPDSGEAYFNGMGDEPEWY